MKKAHKYKFLLFGILFGLTTGMIACLEDKSTVNSVMDKIITELYATKNEKELTSLTYEKVITLFSEKELKILSTRHWMFDVNVPVIVSVMRDSDQKIIPFWLKDRGFKKTGMTMKNEQTTYEVWQKLFKAGKVGLGIHGFDGSGLHYFVSVAPKKAGDQLVLENFFPENQFVGILDNGAFTYHDWDELVLNEVPQSMKDRKLLTTVRGRVTETHLINAFRKTSFPSSSKPDQIMLTWSSDPSTTVDIQWRTDTTVTAGSVIFREHGSNVDNDVVAGKIRMEDRMLMNDRYVNHFTARLTGLKPGITYDYLIAPQTDWTRANSFSTAENDDSFSFLWFGDTHYSSKFGENLQQAFTFHPDAAFFSIAGDLVSDGLHRNQWDDLLKYSGNVICRIPIMAVPGNHDNRAGLGARTFRDLFSYPQNGPEGVEKEQTYSFTYKNCLFLMIDATSPIEAQTDWISQQLAGTKATWKIAMFHFPPYNREEPYLNIQKAWVPVFDKYHVDMVFGGHVHYYMRSKPMRDGKAVASYNDGTAYVISIAIPTRKGKLPDEPYAEVQSTEGQLFQYVKIEGDQLIFQAVNSQNKIIDTFRIKK